MGKRLGAQAERVRGQIASAIDAAKAKRLLAAQVMPNDAMLAEIDADEQAALDKPRTEVYLNLRELEGLLPASHSSSSESDSDESDESTASGKVGTYVELASSYREHIILLEKLREHDAEEIGRLHASLADEEERTARLFKLVEQLKAIITSWEKTVGGIEEITELQRAKKASRK